MEEIRTSTWALRTFHVEAPVLGQALLRDVESGHELQPQHQRRGDLGVGLGLQMEHAEFFQFPDPVLQGLSLLNPAGLPPKLGGQRIDRDQFRHVWIIVPDALIQTLKRLFLFAGLQQQGHIIHPPLEQTGIQNQRAPEGFGGKLPPILARERRVLLVEPATNDECQTTQDIGFLRLVQEPQGVLIKRFPAGIIRRKCDDCVPVQVSVRDQYAIVRRCQALRGVQTFVSLLQFAFTRLRQPLVVIGIGHAQRNEIKNRQQGQEHDNQGIGLLASKSGGSQQQRGRFQPADGQLMKPTHRQARYHHDGQNIKIEIHDAVTGHRQQAAKKAGHFNVSAAAQACLAQSAHEKH